VAAWSCHRARSDFSATDQLFCGGNSYVAPASPPLISGARQRNAAPLLFTDGYAAPPSHLDNGRLDASLFPGKIAPMSDSVIVKARKRGRGGRPSKGPRASMNARCPEQLADAIEAVH